MNMKSVLLLVSVAFNIALMYALVSYTGKSDQSKPEDPLPVIRDIQTVEPTQRPAIREGSAIARLSAVDFNTRDHFALMDQLQQQGLPDEFVRRIMLASIDMELSELARQQESGNQYWQATKPNRKEQVQQELQWASEKRVLLRQLFGDSVEDDPVFEDLFRPFHKTLDFLSSDKQIALFEKVELNQAQSRDMFGPGFIREQMEDRRAMQTDMIASIQELLTPEEYFEYELRESREANRMRQTMTGFDYTEQEFRDIFEIRGEFQDLSQSPFNSMSGPQVREAVMEARDDQNRRIAEYLGTERFAELKRLQDPVYQSLVAIGDRYDSSERSIITAYEITTEFRTRVNEVRRDQFMSGEERRSQITQLSAESLEEIEVLVGEEAAQSIQNNIFRGSRRGFRQ
ncbi:MAG: hypothetical protein QGD92_02590 [Gammaproteobacteria bacterium]|nr:hypothetical protein [Gammaproteobacteria bacterium]